MSNKDLDPSPWKIITGIETALLGIISKITAENYKWFQMRNDNMPWMCIISKMQIFGMELDSSYTSRKTNIKFVCLVFCVMYI